MSVTLPNRLADLRRRVRHALWAYGVGRVTSIFIGAALIVCLADRVFHFDDRGVRFILTTLLLGASGWGAYRFLLRPLSVPFDNVDLALRIEDRYPEFHDSLASAVQFLESRSDPRLGSPALQRAVLRQTLAKLDTFETNDVLESRPVRRSVTMAFGVCLVAAIFAGIDHRQTMIALERLFFPFSQTQWPRQTNLRLLDADLDPLGSDVEPLQVARGDGFKLFAENESGRLPSRVVLEYRLEDGRTIQEAMRPISMNLPQGGTRELAVASLPVVKGGISFRATGGDDTTMSWHRLQVVPPPVVETLQLVLTPPPYSRRSVEMVPEGVGHAHGLVGTQVDVVASVSKPLESAFLRIRDQPPIPIETGEDGKSLRASFLIGEAGLYSWWLDLEDTEGFENATPPRYEIQGLLDAEPEIRIELPASDIQVTAEAEVHLRTTAKDDLGLQEMRLVFRRETDEPGKGTTVPLFVVAESPANERILEHSVDYDWRLEELNLEEGARVTFHTEATDEFDLKDVLPAGKAPPPHVGRSVSRTLTVVSRQKKTEELAQRQSGLLDDLDRATRLQRQAHSQIDDLRTQLEAASRLRTEDLDALQRTEIGQREVAAQLTHPIQGLDRRARDLLDELRNNRLEDPQSENRLQGISDELDRIAENNLPGIEQALTQARKQLQSAKGREAQSPSGASGSAPKEMDPADRPDGALRNVAENQKEVLESLEDLLQELAQWRNEYDAARDLDELVKQQEGINQKTGELGQQTLTKSQDRLTPQEQADIAKLSERQKKQADQFEQLQSRLKEKIGAASETNPEAAAALSDALEQSREQGVSDQMREAAGQIGDNRLGEAARSQQELLRKLRDLENTLNERQESDTETLVKKLKQAASELDALRNREEELLRKVQEAQKIADPAQRQAELQRLAKQQQQQRDEAAKLARRLQRLQAPRASAAAQRAAGQMQQAGASLSGGGGSAAEQQQEALDDLEQAQRELARNLRQAEEQLAQEQIARIAAELAGMIERQEAATVETRRLDELRRSAGRLTRAQLQALNELSTLQQVLKEDTDRLAEKLTAAEVFAQALRGGARSLQLAVDLLRARETGAETQRLQDSAKRRFVDLVDAWKGDGAGSQGGTKPPDSQEGGGNQQAQPPGEGIPPMAQLKMLLSLQRDLLDRTTRLNEIRESGKSLSTSEESELESLILEQSELADLARNLSALAAEPDDEPEPDESLPSKPESPPGELHPS